MIPRINDTIQSIPEALSIFINQIVYDKVTKGERVYTFSLGEAFFDVPRFPVEDDKFKTGYHYSSSMGQPKLKKKISELYKNHYGAFVDDEKELLISAGSKVIIYMLLRTVLNDGEEVLVHEPEWLSYKEQIKLCRGVHIPVPYDKNVDEWEDYITEKTKVIIINNPNNPSGYLYTKNDLQRLLEMAKKHDLFIISDEAYSDFLLPNEKFFSFASIDKDKEHCLVVNSLSKNMGMSGWRVGYAIAHKNVIMHLKKLNQHLITCAATVLQDYMADHFEEILSYTIPQAVEMANKRQMVQKIMDKLGLKYLPGTCTFYIMLDVSEFKGTTEELVYDLLINHNIAVVPGRAYGESTKDFVRFGIGVESLSDIEKCLKVIKSFITMDVYDNSAIKKKMYSYGVFC